MASVPANNEFAVSLDQEEVQPTRGRLPALLEIWRIARRRRWLIAGIVALFVIGGLIVTLMMAPEYTATARIEISREQKKVTNVQGVQGDESGQDIEFYQTQYALLEAESLATRVAKALNLSEQDAFFEANGAGSQVAELFGEDESGKSSAAQKERRLNSAVRILLENVSISPIRGSSLVDVSYTSRSPTLSARITNEWTKQFIASSIDRRFASTADARQYLEERLSELRDRLQKSEKDVVNYASQKGIVPLSSSESSNGSTQTNQTLTGANLEALNSALTQATADRIAAESAAREAQARGRSENSASNSGNAALVQQRANIAAEYAKMMATFEPSYPPAQALKRQLDSLDKAIDAQNASATNDVVATYRAARAREQTLREHVNELKQQMLDQRRNSIQYNIYQRDADTNRELYNALLQRYKEIGVAGVSANNIAIIDYADIPHVPSSPILILNLLVAFVLGCGVAGSVVFALEQIDEGIKDPQQLSGRLGVPLIGAVPMGVTEDGEELLERLADPRSEIAEAYLTIRSNLSFTTDHGFPRTLLVTSTRPGEGKSISTAALAQVMGRLNQRVLLIDGDMRSPSIHGFFKLDNRRGLTNYLAGDDDWTGLIRPTNQPGVSVIPAGPLPPSAAELLSGDRIGQLLDQLRAEFDYIVVDAPPVLGLADAPLLSRSVEGCVVVVEAGGPPARVVRDSIDRLEKARAHIFGAILTKLKLAEQNYGYGYGYGYGFDYGQKEKHDAS